MIPVWLYTSRKRRCYRVPTKEYWRQCSCLQVNKCTPL